MQYPSLDAFLKTGSHALAKGPVALLFVEDLVKVASTLEHILKLGFGTALVLAPDELVLPGDLADAVHRIRYPLHRARAVEDAVNAVIAAAPGQWMHYGFNAEYLFYPFCETRSIAELLAFHAEERRDAMLTYVVDLYAANLAACPNAVNLEAAYLDRSGYYAQARPDEANHNHPRERQLNFYGGLRWRFEEHVPPANRRIDRIALFRARPGLRLLPGHVFSDEEYNTYACPWHNNITAALCSFRTAKALVSNSGSSADIETFHWHNSTLFEWHSRQLLDLGLIEPGQWF